MCERNEHWTPWKTIENTCRALFSLGVAKTIWDYVNSIYLTAHLRGEGTASEKRLHLLCCRHL